MDVIKKAIVDWLREILIGGIISNLSGMFDSVNEKVGEACRSRQVTLRMEQQHF